jgi:crossover junction endodeoxyribonuclease RuvC
MLIIGVDPGSTATGYGIIRKESSRSTHVASGVIRLSGAQDHPKRLAKIFRDLEGVVKEHAPAIMVVESLFLGENTQSLMKLSQVRGVVLLLGELYGMDIYEYSPMEIKRGLTGYGKADKQQMIFMVGNLLRVPGLKSPDQADALAMALYHSHISLPARCAR